MIAVLFLLFLLPKYSKTNRKPKTSKTNLLAADRELLSKILQSMKIFSRHKDEIKILATKWGEKREFVASRPTPNDIIQEFLHI